MEGEVLEQNSFAKHYSGPVIPLAIKNERILHNKNNIFRRQVVLLSRTEVNRMDVEAQNDFLF